MQLKDVTPIIKAILEERDKIPRIIDKERYIPNPQPYHDGNLIRGGIRKALRIIERAPVVDAMPRWISVEEKLPENKQMVIGYTPCDGYMFVGYYVDDQKWKQWYIVTAMRSTKYMTKKVTHWMYLPPAPEEAPHV